MSSLSDLCEKYFGHRDLYDVLRIPKNADDKQVRKAYHRLSLLVHPDRVDDKKKIEATEKFKVLGKVHSILSDREKRAIYDQTGIYDDDGDDSVEQDWSEYWRLLFKKITLEDIVKYEKAYKDSQEELDDLKRAYLDGKGNMDYILQAVPFSRIDEEDRFKEIIQKMINDKEVPEYTEFLNETPQKKARRKRKWQKEAEEAEKMQKEMNLETEKDLQSLIRSRQQARADNMDSFFDALAAKYAPQKKSTSKKGTGKKSK